MRRIVVLSMITLDGVMQGPGGPEEDPSGGFKHGGWVAPYDDEVYGGVVEKELKPADYLLGRKTFSIWEDYWPAHADFWPGINDGTKYVLSRTRKKSDWKNSVFLRTLADIKRIKKTNGPDLQVWGSGELVQLLLKNDLVDELRLKIHPLTLGKGKKLFAGGAIPAAFTLTESLVTPGGVIIATFNRAGKVRDGYGWRVNRITFGSHTDMIADEELRRYFKGVLRTPGLRLFGRITSTIVPYWPGLR